MRSKMPATHKAQIACVGRVCNDCVFMLLLARAYFLCCIARSNNNEHIFYAVLQEKQRQLYFWCHKKQKQLHFVHCIAREPATNNHEKWGQLWGYDVIPPMQQFKNLYAVYCNYDGKEHIFVLYHKKQQQQWLIATRSVRLC